MTEVTPVTRLFNSGSYEEDLYAKSLGWETPSMLILERAIVISVNLGIDINPGFDDILPDFVDPQDFEEINIALGGAGNDFMA